MISLALAAIIITNDRGGSLQAYMDRGDAVAATGRSIALDGPCMSACAVMVTTHRDVACASLHGELWFHQATVSGSSRHRNVYPAPVAAWIAGHGGEPTSGWLVMRYPETLKFFRACTARDWRTP